MGVTYKLREEVVQFIISQRQDNPLASCRQLAEAASIKFDLHLSKSSVHDVLKESGITTPRGRKPKDKFEIPLEKKKQIQNSLSQVKLLAPPTSIIQKDESSPAMLGERSIKDSSALPQNEGTPVLIQNDESSLQDDIEELGLMTDITESMPLTDSSNSLQKEVLPIVVQKEDNPEEISSEYEEAGRIFYKAALWDLGIFSQDNIKSSDWDYYLTYAKGINVNLENNKSFFIELPLPIERCIREVADGLINNIKPFLVHKVSDEDLFKACMDAQEGFKMSNIAIVGQLDHVLFEFSDLVAQKRGYIFNIRTFVEHKERVILERAKLIFFSQMLNDTTLVESIMNFSGFDTIKDDEIIVSLLIPIAYENKNALQEAVDKLNSMFLRDEENRLVKVVLIF